MEVNSSVDGTKFQEPQSPDAQNSSNNENKLSKISLNPDDVTYDMAGDKFLIIFNHGEFKKQRSIFSNYSQLSPRKGTEYDVQRLKYIFKDILHHKVIVHNDLEYNDILDELVAFTSMDHSQTSSVSVVILTHGDSGGAVSAKDRFYDVQDVLRLFQNGHKSLVGKPKLFFIQACRGHEVEAGRRVETDGTPRTFVIPSQADFLILYSTIEGFVSFREFNGTWMVQTLCDVIETNDNYKHLDILAIVTRVHNKIAYEKHANSREERLDKKKQMTECRFTLTKQMFLTHGK